MDCPRCQQPLKKEPQACEACEFSLDTCDQHYGSEFVVMDRVMDAVSCLTPPEHYQLEVRLAAFEKEFPQLFFVVYTDAIPPGNPILEFSFWLLNRAAVRGIDIDRPNENGILLCLDLNTSSACLTTGFALEKYLPEKNLQNAIRKARGAWSDRQFGEGISQCIDFVAKDLRKAANQIGQNQSITEIPYPIQIKLPHGLESIRPITQVEPEPVPILEDEESSPSTTGDLS